jgi:hypothetical protein
MFRHLWKTEGVQQRCETVDVKRITFWLAKSVWLQRGFEGEIFIINLHFYAAYQQLQNIKGGVNKKRS